MGLVMIYSMVCGARFMLEQPQGSVLFLHPRISQVFQDYFVYKCGVWGGAFATDRSVARPKRHSLMSNDKTLLERMVVAAGQLSGEELAQFDGEPLTKKYRKADGSMGYCGNGPHMKASQSGT